MNKPKDGHKFEVAGNINGYCWIVGMRFTQGGFSF